MQIERIDLSDGQWARAHTRPTHGQMKAFYKAFRNHGPDEAMETQADLITLLCEEWQVKGADGANLPLSKEGIENAPQDIVTELTDHLSEFLNGPRTTADKLKSIADDLDDGDEAKRLIMGVVKKLGN